MYRLTCSLLNNWLYATDTEADEKAYTGFLDALERKQKPKSKAMTAGIDFEAMVNAYAMDNPSAKAMPKDAATLKAIAQFGNRCRGGQLQVREEKEMRLAGMDIQLVGVADCLKCGIIYDMKRVQRYEYGKYQFSAQHPMYLELFPEALRFDYLIFDGTYCYREQYRRGDCETIQAIGQRFLRYLEDADLMDIYQKHWRVDE